MDTNDSASKEFKLWQPLREMYSSAASSPTKMQKAQAKFLDNFRLATPVWSNGSQEETFDTGADTTLLPLGLLEALLSYVDNLLTEKSFPPCRFTDQAKLDYNVQIRPWKLAAIKYAECY